MTQAHDVIIRFLQTEKGSAQAGLGKYLFEVGPAANKIQIKQAVEQLYKVHVTKINTLKVRGRWKRVRAVPGKTSDWKKAVVTLKSGEKIEVA
ncbi:MAG: 50S ribosomal protein L23 [Candidatus Omnitrophica bacterium]|nr:50S ribosomal protein L23 [Candidatus Omnitrophota bacterium]